MVELAQDWSSNLWSACPPNGPSSTIQDFQLSTANGEQVHFISAYAADGLLTGFLAYFPDGFADKIAPGAFAYFVRPDSRRRGIGTALLLAARQRFPNLDFTKQDYTAEGLACYRAAQKVAKNIEQRQFGLTTIRKGDTHVS